MNTLLKNINFEHYTQKCKTLTELGFNPQGFLILYLDGTISLEACMGKNNSPGAIFIPISSDPLMMHNIKAFIKRSDTLYLIDILQSGYRVVFDGFKIIPLFSCEAAEAYAKLINMSANINNYV